LVEKIDKLLDYFQSINAKVDIKGSLLPELKFRQEGFLFNRKVYFYYSVPYTYTFIFSDRNKNYVIEMSGISFIHEELECLMPPIEEGIEKLKMETSLNLQARTFQETEEVSD